MSFKNVFVMSVDDASNFLPGAMLEMDHGPGRKVSLVVLLSVSPTSLTVRPATLGEKIRYRLRRFWRWLRFFLRRQG